jgi:hypothetical protein
MCKQDDDYRGFTLGERAIMREVRELRKEVRQMGAEEQADFTALEGTVEGLVNDEHEVATEFNSLAEEIKGLSAGGTVTAAQINELNAKAVALGEKLKADAAGASA